MPTFRTLLGVLALAGALSAAEPPPPSSASSPAPAAPSGRSSATEDDLSQGASSFDANVPAALEVKKVKTGHLLVRPIINGHSAGWFIFDTGAGICVVSSTAKDGLDLKEAGDLDAVGVGGAKQVKLYRAETVTLGPLTLRDHPVMITDLSFLTPHLGEEISGVIGYGVLSRCVVEMALGEGKISLYDPRTFELGAGGGTWEEMKVTERIPSVKASVEGHEGRFRLDTGANGAMTVHQPAVERWKLLEGRETRESKLGGVGGYVSARRGVLKDITLGGVKHFDVETDFATSSKGVFSETLYDGNIGAGLLDRYALILDYGRQRIALRALAKANPDPAK